MGFKNLNEEFKNSTKTCVICHKKFKHLSDFSAITKTKGLNLVCNLCVLQEKLFKNDIDKIGFTDIVQKVLVRCAFRQDIDDVKDIPVRCKHFKPHLRIFTLPILFSE